MLKLTPLILMLLYVLAMWFFSAWRLHKELNRYSTPLSDGRLTPLMDRMSRAMGVPPIRALIHEVAPVNGLAAPDGRIFLTRGFMDKLDQGEVTPEELASVIAHELGHVSLGHSRRRMIDFAGQNAVRMLLAGILGRVLPGVGAWVANIVATAIAARLSRQDEFEADRFAAALLIKSGIGTDPQISLFRKLDTLTGARAAPPAWAMSHPPAAKRIEAIQAQEARWTST